MARSILASSAAACIGLGRATPLFAAAPTMMGGYELGYWKTHLTHNGPNKTNG